MSRQNGVLTGIQKGTSRFKARRTTTEANFSRTSYRLHDSYSGE